MFSWIKFSILFNWKWGIFIEKLWSDKFIKELVEDVDERLKSVELYSNTIELLEKLKINNIKSAIVTTSKKISIFPALEKYNMHKYFGVVLTAEDVSKHKPDPEVVYKAMELLNAKKEETLIIGDGPKDVAAGKAAGITTVSFYPKDNERFYSENDIKSFGADFVIKDLIELIKIVN